jgi:hypothetical protein
MNLCIPSKMYYSAIAVPVLVAAAVVPLCEFGLVPNKWSIIAGTGRPPNDAEWDDLSCESSRFALRKSPWYEQCGVSIRKRELMLRALLLPTSDKAVLKTKAAHNMTCTVSSQPGESIEQQ